MTIVEQKKALRKKMLIERVKLDKKLRGQHDQWICDAVWEYINQHNCKTVHCYLPMGKEINIFPLIEKMLQEKITVVTPKTLPKRQLQNLLLKSTAEVEKGVYGTSHPAHAQEYNGPYDLIVIPGLAFDADNNRLGYGGAYYDTFLINQPDAYKLGIFYPFQKVEKVPIEAHDVQLDRILYDF